MIGRSVRYIGWDGWWKGGRGRGRKGGRARETRDLMCVASRSVAERTRWRWSHRREVLGRDFGRRGPEVKKTKEEKKSDSRKRRRIESERSRTHLLLDVGSILEHLSNNVRSRGCGNGRSSRLTSRNGGEDLSEPLELPPVDEVIGLVLVAMGLLDAVEELPDLNKLLHDRRTTEKHPSDQRRPETRARTGRLTSGAPLASPTAHPP